MTIPGNPKYPFLGDMSRLVESAEKRGADEARAEIVSMLRESERTAKEHWIEYDDADSLQRMNWAGYFAMLIEKGS